MSILLQYTVRGKSEGDKEELKDYSFSIVQLVDSLVSKPSFRHHFPANMLFGRVP